MNPLVARATLFQIEALWLSQGHRHVADGADSAEAPAGSVSLLEHALQCAQLAEWAHADDTLVAAAFLHDIGHALRGPVDEAGPLLLADDGEPDGHELLALPMLAQAFDAAVTEPIRLHVTALRYLVGADARYAQALLPAAQARLYRLGGAMGRDEMRRFEALPHADAAIRLCLWDDLARHPGKATPPLEHYLRLLAALIGDATRAAVAAQPRPLRAAMASALTPGPTQAQALGDRPTLGPPLGQLRVA